MDAFSVDDGNWLNKLKEDEEIEESHASKMGFGLASSLASNLGPILKVTLNPVIIDKIARISSPFIANCINELFCRITGLPIDPDTLDLITESIRLIIITSLKYINDCKLGSANEVRSLAHDGSEGSSLISKSLSWIINMIGPIGGWLLGSIGGYILSVFLGFQVDTKDLLNLAFSLTSIIKGKRSSAQDSSGIVNFFTKFLSNAIEWFIAFTAVSIFASYMGTGIVPILGSTIIHLNIGELATDLILKGLHKLIKRSRLTRISHS